jgi:DNA-binding NarL/FixJ family response regulator
MATKYRRPTDKTRILLVDDHPLMCRGMRMLIDDETDMEVCGEAADTMEAMRLVKATRPDVVIVDLTLTSGHGLELLQDIQAHDDRIRTLVSSMHDENLFAERCLRAGARGYLSKREAPENFIKAIRHILRDEIYLSPRMSKRLLQRLTRGEASLGSPISALTDREREVFEMIGHGLATKQIAKKLSLSIKTVELHCEKIKSRLKLNNSSELTRQATQWVLENA